MKNFYRVNKDLRLTSEKLEDYDNGKLRLESIASTSYKSGKTGHRINLPVFSDPNGVLAIPECEIPKDLMDLVLDKGEWNLYLRSRSEIVRSFSMMMKYDPEGIVARTHRN
ncbi:hypothetical protein [Vibrio phage Va2]|nr:hypothetical protein [Vibrio phage Va2]